MFISIQQLLCAVVPTALAARCQARIALDAGEYGMAASYYMTAGERLGDRVLEPQERHPLFPQIVSACARSSYRAAIEEGQEIKELKETGTYEDTGLRMIAGILASSNLQLHECLTSNEQLLLALKDPLSEPRLMSDLGAAQLYRKTSAARGIRRLFAIRYLAALAEQGDMDALRKLGQEAIHSNTAYRALCRLAANGVKEASLELIMVRSERHSMFLYRQRMERQRLEDDVNNARFMF